MLIVNDIISMTDQELLQAWMLWKARQIGREYQGKELAADSGLSEQYLSAVKTGRRGIGKITREKLSLAFGVTPSQFLAGPTSETPEEIIMKHARKRLELRQEGEKGESMQISPDDLARARAVKIICALSSEKLERALGYLEGITERDTKEAISKIS